MGACRPGRASSRGCGRSRDRNGALLVFDEVITGFRVAYGGAQALYGVTPDLTCLGKIIGGGLPVGAYGGRARSWRRWPRRPRLPGGHALRQPAGDGRRAARRSTARGPGFYDELEADGARLESGLRAAAPRGRGPGPHQPGGLMLTVVLRRGTGRRLRHREGSDTQRYARFFRAMLERGVYLPPSQFEAAFVSLAHGDAEIDETVRAAEQAFRAAV